MKRTRYIAPLRKRTGGVELDRLDLQFFGRCLIKFIQQEALKDAAKSPSIPRSQDFLDSFHFQVRANTIEVFSTWPWINSLIEGQRPYPMKWLTRAHGVSKIPLRDKNGQVVIRTAPLTTDKAWIHPGIAKHHFIERAFRKAQTACVDRFLKKNLGRILDRTF